VLFLVRSPNELFSPSTIGESVREAVGSANRTPTQYTPGAADRGASELTEAAFESLGR
jgi:hypothetical protein